MLNRLVRDREFGQVVPDHLRLDFHGDVLLAIVDSDDAANHLWDDHHVPQMSSDCFWLLAVCRFTLGCAQLLEKGDRLSLDSTAELAALTRTEQLHQILVAHVQKLVQVHAAVGEFLEVALLALLLVSHGGEVV